MAKKRASKVRAEFRKGYDGRTRKKDFTRRFAEPDALDSETSGERMTGKGALTRRRTLVGAEDAGETSGVSILREVDSAKCRAGRVLSVHGLSCRVADDSGVVFRCATRGILKSISTDQRQVVAAGDHVQFQPIAEREGVIERVEPRTQVLSRTSRGKRHVIAANVDQLLIVGSAAEPRLKPGLIDRFLVSAEASGIRPIVCINKIDLVDPAEFVPIVGVYSQMGYPTFLVSVKQGAGVDALRRLFPGRQTAIAGQSGVGKSSLLNAIDPSLKLRVAEVSAENQKGRHTTTAASLIPFGDGWLVDTPGIRQFQLWDVSAEEVAGYFRDLRPYVSLCRFPDCTHVDEEDCAVKGAVADGRLDLRRYESYVHLFQGDLV